MTIFGVSFVDKGVVREYLTQCQDEQEVIETTMNEFKVKREDIRKVKALAGTWAGMMQVLAYKKDKFNIDFDVVTSN